MSNTDTTTPYNHTRIVQVLSEFPDLPDAILELIGELDVRCLANESTIQGLRDEVAALTPAPKERKPRKSKFASEEERLAAKKESQRKAAAKSKEKRKLFQELGKKAFEERQAAGSSEADTETASNGEVRA